MDRAIRTIVFGVWAYSTLGNVAAAQSPVSAKSDATRVKQFAATLDSLRTQLGIPGLSAAILRDQKVIWSAGMGFADVEHKIAATADTPYEIASISKTFASTLLMQLVEQGKLSLDEPMSKYSTFYKNDSVKVRHVFTHTSQGVPGDKWEYNGNLFENLSDVVKGASGRRYREVLSREIIEKINLTSTSPGNDLAIDQQPMRELLGAEPLARYASVVSRVAKPYRMYASRDVVPTRETLFGIGASNGMISTVMDLARYDAAIDRHTFIRAETQQLAWTNTKSNSGQSLPYGLGWMVQSVAGQKLIWHNGYLPDLYSALVLKAPDAGVTLILLANSDAISSPFSPGKGDVATSAFGCAFLEQFVFKSPSDVACRERSMRAAREWVDAKNLSAHKETKLAPEVLTAIAGTYEVRPGTQVTLVVQGNQLVRQSANGDVLLFSESANEFFAKSLDMTYSIERDASNTVTGVRVRRNGQETYARRVTQ